MKSLLIGIIAFGVFEHLSATIYCPVPRHIDFKVKRRLYAAEFVAGDTIQFRCPPGYKLNSKYSKSTCYDEYGWIPDIPECVNSSSCQYREPPVNGRVETSYQDQYHPGQEVIFFCKAGYFLFGKRKDVCLSNGNWENDLPRCRKMRCPRRRRPTNGGYYKVGAKIFFVCFDGYTLVGKKKDVCLRSGKWRFNDTPHCRINTCPYREPPGNGTFHPNKKKYRSKEKITFSCDDGFDLVGNPTDKCRRDGKWRIDDTPHCISR